MIRKKGSGFARDTAIGCELLLAGCLADNDEDLEQGRVILETEWRRGYCGVHPRVLEQWLLHEARHLAWDVVSAVAQPNDLLGDVKVILADGTRRWIEVKAQTTKSERELVQTDWIRDETDFVAGLLDAEPRLARLISPSLTTSLKSLQRHPSLELAELLVADIALAQTPSKKVTAKILDRGSLWEFVDSKSALLISTSGIRHLPMSEVIPVAAARRGEHLRYDIESGTKSRAIVKVAVGARPGPGTTHVTYYLEYPSGVIGRHKLHNAALP